MHEFKHDELKQNNGRKIRNPRQAVAIALSVAGASNRQSPATNKKRLRQTKAKEHHGQPAKRAVFQVRRARGRTPLLLNYSRGVTASASVGRRGTAATGINPPSEPAHRLAELELGTKTSAAHADRRVDNYAEALAGDA
jgi:hypothetical protein